MDKASEDPIATLKKAEDEGQARVEAARKDAAFLVKKANERSTLIIEGALSEASAARDDVFESTRAESVGEAKAVISSAETEANRLRLRRLDDEVVSKCLNTFLGDCGV